MNELAKYILGLNLKDGDVIFVNAHMVDMDGIQSMEWPKETPNVVIVPLVTSHGESIHHHVLRPSKAELMEHMKEAVA